MELLPTIELDRHLIAPRDAVDRTPGARDKTETLGTWMMALGAIRLGCAIATYAMAAVQAGRLAPSSVGRWDGFFHENPPILLLTSAWPLLLGLALRRTRWPEWLKAASLTFFILSIGGVLATIADWGDGRARWISVGSFRVAREALPGLGAPVIAIGLLGAAQLLLEFWTAGRAGLLAFGGQVASPVDSDRHTLAQRSRFGRAGLWISLGFLIVMVRLPAGSAFVELLNQSRTIREFLLRDDFRRIQSHRIDRQPTPDAMRLREMEIMLSEASQAWSSERYNEARDQFRRVIAMTEAIPQSSLTTSGRYGVARAYNGWAWLLATCPEEELRDSREALIYARRATDLEPNMRDFWNTLGVAYYRLGDWEEARSALYRSMELSDEGDAFDWFFLAMIHAKFGHKERSRDWYDKAVQWSHQAFPGNGELYRFQVEAAEVLGLPRPERIPAPPQIKPSRPPGHPTYPHGTQRRRGLMLNHAPELN